jgi:hypothetical protein
VSTGPPITRSRERKYRDLGIGPVLTRVQALSGAPPLPLGRGSNAATWLIVRDVGQRAEHDVRALGRVAFAFIAERTRCLSTLLTGDVPPQHLLRPVHSAGRRRQGHPADGARATLQTAHLSSPLPKQCARAARCTVLIPCTRSFPLHAEAIQILGVRAQEDRSSSKY